MWVSLALTVRKSLLPPQTATPPPSLLHKLNVGGMPRAIMLDYATIAKNDSPYNTLPNVNLWVAGQVIANLVSTFGKKRISGQEEIANRKAEVYYETVDKYPEIYRVVPDKSVRSRMKTYFRVHKGDEAKEKEFLASGEKRSLTGLKGHRSVGSIRASIYNVVPMVNAQKLVAYLVEYAMS